MALGGEKARTDILDSLAPLLIQHSSIFTRSRAVTLADFLLRLLFYHRFLPVLPSLSSSPQTNVNSPLSSCLDKQPPLLISN